MPVRLPQPSKAEEIALFRLSVVGDLLARDLAPGELGEELLARASRRYRPPGARSSRTFHWKTLQDWYYAAKRGGHAALAPASRVKGFAGSLPPETRDLLLQIRKENPSASAGLILEVAVQQGALAAGEISTSTLRRLFAAAGASREASTARNRRERRRWDAGRVGALWHADVCHVWIRDATGAPRKIYVHGVLDDHSRYVVALEARDHEQEIDWLAVLCGALLRLPKPEVLYLDNGACYRGETLALACGRLGIRLLHAQPYDPQARGKMERFWKTFRGRCGDHLRGRSSLQDVNAALLAYLDADYHAQPHGGLMGATPAKAFQAGRDRTTPALTAKQLADALEIAVKRKIGNALTFSLDGKVFEVRGRHLAGETVEVVLDPFADAPLRVLHDGKPVVFGACDAVANARSGRGADAPVPEPTVPFDPIAALLRKARKVTE